MRRAVTGKYWNDDAANELADGFVCDSDDDFIANLLSGPCSEDAWTGRPDCSDGGIVVDGAMANGDDHNSFTVEFALDSIDACQGLIDMFASQMADPTSALMACDGGDLDPCWDIDPSQTLDTHCIDAR
jgi:hypothetical protein